MPFDSGGIGVDSHLPAQALHGGLRVEGHVVVIEWQEARKLRPFPKTRNLLANAPDGLVERVDPRKCASLFGPRARSMVHHGEGYLAQVAIDTVPLDPSLPCPLLHRRSRALMAFQHDGI